MHQIRHSSASEANQLQPSATVLLDTDIGDDIDDALALALILKSPEIALQGVTTVFGDTRRRAHLAAHLLKVFGRTDILVAAGVGTPLQPNHRPSGVPQAALLDEREAPPTTALSPLSGPDLICQTAHQHSGQLTLLCIGPLTNVACALLQEPQLALAIRNIVMMGGTSGLPFAEYNVRSDARAAHIVLSSGIPITMVGMNITTRCQLSKYNLEQLWHNPSPQTQFLCQLLALWQQHRPRWHPALPYLHDPLAAAALCKQDFFNFGEMTVHVVTRGLFKGLMIPRLDGPTVHAAVAVQAKKARAWILERLLAPSDSTETTHPGSATSR